MSNLTRTEIEALIARIKSQNSIHNWHMPLKEEALDAIASLLAERDFYLNIMEEVSQAVRTTTDVTVWFPSLARLMEAADSATGIKHGLEER